MTVSIFEARFKGGHPNSLGNTKEIVTEVLADKTKLQALLDTWMSSDELVRLRVANGVRRVCVEKPDWIAPYIEDFLGDIGRVDQPSTQWTLAKLFQMLETHMSPDQKLRATKHMQHKLANHKDWIVLNNSMETLTVWSKDNPGLAKWLKPQLERLTRETRKSVAQNATKRLTEIDRQRTADK